MTSEVKGEEIGFVDIPKAEIVGDEAFSFFGFDEAFVRLPSVVEGEEDGVFVVVDFKVPLA